MKSPNRCVDETDSKHTCSLLIVLLEKEDIHVFIKYCKGEMLYSKTFKCSMLNERSCSNTMRKMKLKKASHLRILKKNNMALRRKKASKTNIVIEPNLNDKKGAFLTVQR